MRRTLLLASMTLAALAAVSGAWAAAAPKSRELSVTVCGTDDSSAFDLSEYDGVDGSFLCNVRNFCQLQIGATTPLGDGLQPAFRWDVSSAGQLLSFDKPTEYPRVKSMAQLTWLEPSGIFGNGIATAVSDASSCTPSDTYRSLMNSAFNCALWGTKVEIHKQVALSADDDKFKDYLKKLDVRLEGKITPTSDDAGSDSCDKARSCVSGLKDVPAASLSVRLASEASYRQCVYRYYLAYLDETVSRKGPKLIGDGLAGTGIFSAGSGAVSAELVVGISGRLQAKIKDLDDKSVQSYMAAISAFSEFARTYGPHIMLQLIERDYVRLREAMEALMNPVSQVLYKATNAMSVNGTK